VCSLTDGERLATLCPFRFAEEGRLFKDAGRLAFGTGSQVIAVEQVRVLRAEPEGPSAPGRVRRIGKIDYVIARLADTGTPVDFAALEVQSVYFSGGPIRPVFKQFMETGQVPAGTGRRPDWRSSAQKRLMPQLALKVPVFRRWGKKFFVAVDQCFFEALPTIKRVDDPANSEVTWLVYPFALVEGRFKMGDPRPVFTIWEDIQAALREGREPSPDDILTELTRIQQKKGLPVYVT